MRIAPANRFGATASIAAAKIAPLEYPTKNDLACGREVHLGLLRNPLRRQVQYLGSINAAIKAAFEEGVSTFLREGATRNDEAGMRCKLVTEFNQIGLVST
jgi:hypothetical protein